MITEDITPKLTRQRRGKDHLQEDLKLLRNGILDWRSFLAGRELVENPVMVEVRGANGKLKARRYTHNSRTNDGIDWQARQMGGGHSSSTLAATGFVQNAPTTLVAITAPTSTAAGKITDTNTNITSGTATLNQFLGCTLIYADTTVKAAHIVGNSAASASSVIWYFDNWYLPTDWSTTVAAPAANKAYAIVSGGSPAFYIGLATNAGGQAVTDHTIGNGAGASAEIGSGVASAPAATGLGRAFGAAATFWAHTAGTNTYQLKNTFTASGSFTAVQQCGMFTANYLPGDAAADLTNVGKGGGVMVFENTFSSVNMISGDTLTITWTVTY